MTPFPSSATTTTAAAAAANSTEGSSRARPSEEFLSKIKKFSSPVPATQGGADSIAEKINAIAATVGKAAPPALATTPSSAAPKAKTVHIPLTQTVASANNIHQRALALNNSNSVDSTWESNSSKVLRGQKKKTEVMADEADSAVAEVNTRVVTA